MDHASEALMRSALHDLANCLSGIRGILELSDASRPISPRDQARLDAVLLDGMGVLDRARHLAMGTLPDGLQESGTDWRFQLHEQLKPMGVLFRCDFTLAHEGDPLHDRWPGELLRGYAVALARQVLPYVQSGCLSILTGADSREWRIRFSPAPGIPESIRPELEARPRDISARWALRVGGSLGATLQVEQETLLIRVPRF